MKAVGIVGSPRPHGSTMLLAQEALRALADRGAQTQLFQISALSVGYCTGCKACEATGWCVQADDVARVVAAMRGADLVLVASPSYWGDITGQLKVFIDRCTPFGNTNPARAATFSARGAAIAVRAGSKREESLRVVGTIAHFLGHLDIPLAGHFTAEGIATEADLRARPEVLAGAYALGEALSALPD